MTFLIIALLLTVGTIILSASLLHALPRFLQKIIVFHPIISFAFNMGLSVLIAFFIGTGMISGVSHLIGSALFALYCVWFKHQLA